VVSVCSDIYVLVDLSNDVQSAVCVTKRKHFTCRTCWPLTDTSFPLTITCSQSKTTARSIDSRFVAATSPVFDAAIAEYRCTEAKNFMGRLPPPTPTDRGPWNPNFCSNLSSLSSCNTSSVFHSIRLKTYLLHKSFPRYFSDPLWTAFTEFGLELDLMCRV